MSAKKQPTYQEPSPDEWDFRMLNSHTNFETLLEYEFFRSSKLRGAIEAWHASDFRQTAFSKAIHCAEILREAGLIKYSDRSPLGRFCRPENDAVSFDQGYRIMTAAVNQLEGIAPLNCTIAGAISRIFAHVADVDSLSWAMTCFSGDLPETLVDANADKVALRFERFPEPWLRIQSQDETYLQRRCFVEKPHPDCEPMWERGHWMVDTEALGCVPSLKEYSFIIDWRFDPHEVRKAFSEWLNRMHPRARPGVKRHLGWLRRLAAYRLITLGKLKVEEAKTVLKRRIPKVAPPIRWDVLPNIGSKSSWSRDVSLVKRELAGNFVLKIRDNIPQGYSPSGAPR